MPCIFPPLMVSTSCACIQGKADCPLQASTEDPPVAKESQGIRLAHRGRDGNGLEMDEVSSLLSYENTCGHVYKVCCTFTLSMGWGHVGALRQKIEGAIRHCTKRKLTKTAKHVQCSWVFKTNKHYKLYSVLWGHYGILILRPSGRKCIYDTNTTKYLVQTRDEVEQGDEKMKELEMELEQMGLYDSDFNLGDVLDEPEDDQKPATDPQKRRLPDFPQVEGEETVVEYVGQYKKACLTRKALLKTTKERLDRDKAQGYETLGLKCVSQNYMCT